MSENNGSPAPKPTVEELRAEIKQTRAELGETVQALAAKADVKARAKEQVEQTKLKVKAQAAEATERFMRWPTRPPRRSTETAHVTLPCKPGNKYGTVQFRFPSLSRVRLRSWASF